MNSLKRYISDLIRSDLSSRMVFVGGPRQVGKTTLSLKLLQPQNSDESHPAYLNWDLLEMRERILRGELPSDQPLLILDEIHKYAEWRNLLKGLYDTRKSKQQFLVTGSARLDYYRKGGDSLQGRYHYFRLHPFSVGELQRLKQDIDIEPLLNHGGFPEPLFRSSENFTKRWRRERHAQVLREDLRDLEHVREISKIELLLTHLPKSVGSPLSIESFRKLLAVSHESVQRWISILENLYLCFRIAPYGAPKVRAVKKEQKLYFWDWSVLEDPGARFENLVASQLLKYCHYCEDTEGDEMELRFLRDRDSREIDFVVLKNRQPMMAVECKHGERQRSKHIKYFRERTQIPKFYQVHLGEKEFGDEEIDGRVLPFEKFCEVEGMV